MDYIHTKITNQSFKDDETFLKALDIQSIQDVISRSKVNAVSSLVVTILFLVFTPFHNDYPVLARALLVMIVCLVSIRYAAIFSYSRFHNTYPVLWRLFHLLSLGMITVFWSSLTITILSLYGLNWVCMFVIIMVSGITSASTTSFAPRQNL